MKHSQPHTPITLVLLDVDGVLLHPAGYKEALRATVDLFAAQMGQPPVRVDDDEIAVFEAYGITNEWDSSAICVSALLHAALRTHPDLCRATLADTLAAVAGAGIALVRPPFRDLPGGLGYDASDGQIPAALYLAQLAAQADPASLPLFAALLNDIYSLDTPTTRLFQTHTLGSRRFEETYGQPAPLERESYLARYDRPLLAPAARDQLLRWQAQPGHGATIFTARPSLPPADLPGMAQRFAPEAELAAECVGLAGHLPLMAQGRIAWIAQQYGRPTPEYLKPAPVQALAAIGAAASHHEVPALHAAARLYELGDVSGPLADLRGEALRVVVLEDAPTGIHAVRSAVERLRAAGFAVTFEPIGVSPQPDKRAALEQVAGRVVPDVNAGLALVFEGAGG